MLISMGLIVCYAPVLELEGGGEVPRSLGLSQLTGLWYWDERFTSTTNR